MHVSQRLYYKKHSVPDKGFVDLGTPGPRTLSGCDQGWPRSFTVTLQSMRSLTLATLKCQEALSLYVPLGGSA